MFGLAVLLLAAPALADREQELGALRARIEKLSAELEETRGERDAAREHLRAAERRIGGLHRQLHDTEARARTEASRLATLERTRAHSRRELATRRQDLEQAVRAAYALGRQETLKLLLSQEDPARVNRALTYYRYLSESRAARIEGLTAGLARLDAVEKQIAARSRTLAELRAEQLRQKQSLEASRAERRVTLTRLNAELRGRSQEIERLKHDQARLTRLVRELGTALAQSPLPPAGGADAAKGRWRLPVKGRLIARYGSPRQAGDLRWRGIFLAAPEGEPVRAPARGRIAYADWLRGFGLLLVLDHGHGLMTLYGHNLSLYKGVGDPVEAGETIAVSGNTGGPPQPGLYFEVRERGEPRNPLDWCKL